jgi:hypothetical protein
MHESKVYLRSYHGRFLCAEPSGRVVADRTDCAEWETWTMRTTHCGQATFQSFHGKYLCAEVPHHLPLFCLLAPPKCALQSDPLLYKLGSRSTEVS